MGYIFPLYKFYYLDRFVWNFFIIHFFIILINILYYHFPIFSRISINDYWIIVWFEKSDFTFDFW